MNHEDYIKKRDEALIALNNASVLGRDRAIHEAAQAIDALILEARLDEATKGWEQSCDLPSADAISRSLAGRKRYLEAQIRKGEQQ